MKKKILGILICMLLIATGVPAVTSLKNNAINVTVPSTPLITMSADWTEMQKLLALDGAAGDNFGFSVALDGNTALIGAWNDENVGSSYVFTRTGTIWTQQAKLSPSDGSWGDEFGFSVALDGDTALIGVDCDDDKGANSGSAYVFTRSGTTWTQQAKLLASDGASMDLFGHSVSIDRNIAIIGAWGDDSHKGSAYVFSRTGTTWTQQAKLLALDGTVDNYFGGSVSLNGNTVIIGACADDNYKGSAYIFSQIGTTWTQQAKLLSADGAAYDVFGFSVSLDGDTALIGADADGDNGAHSGSAYVFTRTGTTWMQQAKLLASDGTVDDYFGCSVSLDGDSALIGAYIYDDTGSAYVFTRTGTTWTQQQKLLPSDGATGDYFGQSVSLDGNTALIGAPYHNDNGPDSGSAYVFTKVQVPILDLIDIKGGLLGLSVVLTNLGEGTAENIYWEMNASGGLFYPRTNNGTLDTLYPGQEETIPIRPVFGFGTPTITFSCKYKIVNFSYDIYFEVKQEWRNLALLFLDSFPEMIQPAKNWTGIENYRYFNRTNAPGVELYYVGINNMHNVRVVLDLPFRSQEIEFLAACKFTNGIGILHEGGITKELITSGAAHWEVELVDGE